MLHEQRQDPAPIDRHEVTSLAHHDVMVDALKHPVDFSDRPQASQASFEGAP